MEITEQIRITNVQRCGMRFKICKYRKSRRGKRATGGGGGAAPLPTKLATEEIKSDAHREAAENCGRSQRSSVFTRALPF
jgi:hypothetical protein